MDVILDPFECQLFIVLRFQMKLELPLDRRLTYFSIGTPLSDKYQTAAITLVERPGEIQEDPPLYFLLFFQSFQWYPRNF